MQEMSSCEEPCIENRMESLYRGCLQVRVNALQGLLTRYIAFN